MAIRLNADEAWTVYCALDDALRNRRNGIGSKHDIRLTEEDHRTLQGRYLRAALVLDRIEKEKSDDQPNGQSRNTRPALTIRALLAEREALEAELVEARRRRDAWKAKAEGYDEVRLALREKVGTPWPPSLSRILWAGIAADEKKRADDAEAEVERLREAVAEAVYMLDPEAEDVLRGAGIYRIVSAHVAAGGILPGDLKDALAQISTKKEKSDERPS